ncbi:hypothetical protein, partial [Acetonema longum]|uniref:hypothetical protein n=1 Tax=Acetonema longum TaxID=2374 RepID=UPI00145F4935
LSFKTILQRWRDTLAASGELKAFCQSRFGKAPTLIIHSHYAALPEESSCPCIILSPGYKIEGPNEDEFIYYVMIRWSIVNATIDTSTPGITEYTGLYDSDDFGQLIYSVLDQVSRNYPVGRVNTKSKKKLPFPSFPATSGARSGLTRRSAAPLSISISHPINQSHPCNAAKSRIFLWTSTENRRKTTCKQKALKANSSWRTKPPMDKPLPRPVPLNCPLTKTP